MIQDFAFTEKFTAKIDVKKVIGYFTGIPRSVILDSSLYNEDAGRFTIIGFDPCMFFTSKGREMAIQTGERKDNITGDPFTYLRSLMKKYELVPQNDGLPFHGGYMGYFSYDLVGFIEKIETKSCDDLKINDIELGLYNKAIIFDHMAGEIFIVVSSIGIRQKIKTEMTKNLYEISSLLSSIADQNEKAQSDSGTKQQSTEKIKSNKDICSNFNKETYMDIVQKAREHIRNGDIFQVNLSQRFETDINRTPGELYISLRNCSPAPFCAFLNFEDVQVLSSSPERYLKIDGRYIETRPIKGTRPRGCDKQSDDAMKKELLESPKERAELTMIVDLERNDLGRICEFGSVDVKSHFIIEEYANVFHAVSTVTGIIKEGKDIIDCICATFPGGSITGAPKVRAMEIIEELEPVKRGIYTGAIGYIGFDGRADLNIAIRTIIIKGGRAYYNVGGGIVWDSIPEDEYFETLHKGTKMLEVLTGG
ncbi:MAG: aminodeoxychorismate synthase component I [Saccharofermentanales bacterium]